MTGLIIALTIVFLLVAIAIVNLPAILRVMGYTATTKFPNSI
ncbi:hypothetical protein [Erythrobacter sp. MTPC3]